MTSQGHTADGKQWHGLNIGSLAPELVFYFALKKWSLNEPQRSSVMLWVSDKIVCDVMVFIPVILFYEVYTNIILPLLHWQLTKYFSLEWSDGTTLLEQGREPWVVVKGGPRSWNPGKQRRETTNIAGSNPTGHRKGEGATSGMMFGKVPTKEQGP